MLQGLNYAAMGIQLALCVLLIVWLFIRNDQSADIEFDIGEFGGEDACATLFSFDLNTIIYLLIAFTAVTALFHLLYATGAKGWYGKALEAGNNWARWLEYSITATIMLVAIALISGVWELDSLILIAVASVGCMLCGQVSEKTKSPVSTIIGWLLLIGAFAVIFRNFNRAVNPEDPQQPKPPSWVWALVIIMALLYLSFGVIQLTCCKQYVNTERAYTIASMAAKTALVLIIFGGIIGQSSA